MIPETIRPVIEIPLFPLRSVLCPGVALPLHIFEQRYRLMVDRCIERGEPFGVVLLREGREAGPFRGQVAAVGTTAIIRRAGAYPDGRLDILTVGQQRFRLEGVDNVSEPYLVGRISLLDEPTGPMPAVDEQAQRVGQRFLEYLELLQPTGEEDGPEIEKVELEIELDEVDDHDSRIELDDEPEPEPERTVPTTLDDLLANGSPLEASGLHDAADAIAYEPDPSARPDASELSAAQRRELLMAAARRLIGTDDPTALSYVLTALIQVDLAARQELLEAPDTIRRLSGLERLLTRETWFLRQGLRPIIVDARQGSGHAG